MCVRTKDEPSTAIAVDSGLVDINELFGLNLSRKDKVEFRKRTTCAVLPLEGHVDVMKAADHPLEFVEAICPNEGMFAKNIHPALRLRNIPY
jgi:hypothetical protein